MRYALIMLAFIPAALGGCVSSAPRPGFEDVQSRLSPRLPQRVQWRQDGPDDVTVSQQIDDLLNRRLSVDEAVQIALLNNRRLQAVYEQLGVAQAQVVQAGLLSNPVLDAAVKFPIDGGVTKLDFSVVQNFLDVFFIPLRKSVAESEFEAAKLRVTAATLDFAGDTGRAFYRAQADAQTVELFEQVVASTSASFNAATRLRDAGNIPSLQLKGERAQYDQARLDLAEAQSRALESREHLTALMGLWGGRTEWTIAARLPDVPDGAVDLNNVESRAIAASVDLALARQDVESQARRLGLVRAGTLLINADAGATAEREDGSWFVGPVVSLPIPLFDQGQARVGTAQSKLRQSLDAYEAGAVEVRAAARRARDRLLAANRAAVFYRDELLPLREQIIHDTLLSYNAMQIGVFELLLAKQQQIETARRYVESLEAYWLARVDFEQMLRGRLAGFLPDALANTGGVSSSETLDEQGGH